MGDRRIASLIAPHVILYVAVAFVFWDITWITYIDEVGAVNRWFGLATWILAVSALYALGESR